LRPRHEIKFTAPANCYAPLRSSALRQKRAVLVVGAPPGQIGSGTSVESLTKITRELCVGKDAIQRTGECFCITGLNQYPGLAIDDEFRDPAHAARDNGKTISPGLKNSDAERLGTRR
jgi:hypothetical protein